MRHLLLGLVVAICGCGSGDGQRLSEGRSKIQGERAPATPRSHAMFHFGFAYTDFASRNGQGPSGLSDMKSHTGFEILTREITSGEFIVIWNAEFARTGNDSYLLAYEKKVPQSGGLVITGGGSVRKLTPTEFHAVEKMPTRPPQKAPRK